MRFTAIGSTMLAAVVLCAAGARAHAANPNLGQQLPELKFQGVGLKDALDFVRDVSGANLHVNWRALEAAGVSPDTQVNLRLRDVSMGHLLTLLLTEAGNGTATLAYYVDEGVIEVTTKELADKNMVTRVYPIEDLLLEIPDFPSTVNFDLTATATGGSAGGTPGGGSGNGLFTQQQAPEKTMSRAERVDAILSLIRETVAPEIWQENGGNASIRYLDGKLIVTAPLWVQQAIGGS